MRGVWRTLVPTVVCVGLGYGSVFVRAYRTELREWFGPSAVSTGPGPDTVPAEEIAGRRKAIERAAADWDAATRACSTTIAGAGQEAAAMADEFPRAVRQKATTAELGAALDGYK